MLKIPILSFLNRVTGNPELFLNMRTLRNTVFIAALVLCLSTLSMSQAPGEEDESPLQSGQQQQQPDAIPLSQASASFGGSFASGGGGSEPPLVGGAGGGGGAEAVGGRAYSFSYSVNDPATGNVHSRQESSDNTGVVTGQYQLIEPDGTLRIVDYVADSRGFRPTIRRIPNYAPPPPQPPRRVRSLTDTIIYRI